MVLKVSLEQLTQIEEFINDFYKLRKEALGNSPILESSTEDNSHTDIDEFDHNRCYYLLSISDGELVGGVRLTSSIYSNLTFESLSHYSPLTQEINQSSELLELSKFTIKPLKETYNPHEMDVRIRLLRGIFKFALNNGFKKVITIADTKTEKLLNFLGITTTRINSVHPESATFIVTFDVNSQQYRNLKLNKAR